ncbi:MAG TPA: hypothetical protein VGS12_07930 [Caulobacteraceae bacterium]|nr:hypothetical protein [Caulobacteraceae bacterium]
MAVPRAIELDDALPTRHSAGQTQGVESSFRPRTHEANHLCRWRDLDDAPGHTDGQLGNPEIMRPACSLGSHRRHQTRMAMPKHKWPGAQHEVEIPPAVHIEYMHALAALDDELQPFGLGSRIG